MTIIPLERISEFDEIIDVRSPSEYAQDHIPGAINLPVLDDAERARVGTIYVQGSKVEARKIGATLVARNSANHLENHLRDKDGSYRPLVYCWRGGQRSGSFAIILKQIGWRVGVLDGGYRNYRNAVWDQLYNQDFPTRVILLDGNTGTAKTALLGLLAERGFQVIDLEGLANHRGSLFGAAADVQPSQKAFETRLAAACGRLDPKRPVVVEAESSKIGRCTLPPSLLGAMRRAPRIVLRSSLDQRAHYVTHTYADLVADKDRLVATLGRLRPYHAAEQVKAWTDLAMTGRFEQLAGELIAMHYDPRYAKQRARKSGQETVFIDVPDLSPDGLVCAANDIGQTVKGMSDRAMRPASAPVAMQL
ncbi:MAG: tRNA 2-selenouridine(34) synthase MnmH [Methyloligellaceae bacterium]